MRGIISLFCRDAGRDNSWNSPWRGSISSKTPIPAAPPRRCFGGRLNQRRLSCLWGQAEETRPQRAPRCCRNTHTPPTSTLLGKSHTTKVGKAPQIPKVCVTRPPEHRSHGHGCVQWVLLVAKIEPSHHRWPKQFVSTISPEPRGNLVGEE